MGQRSHRRTFAARAVAATTALLAAATMLTPAGARTTPAVQPSAGQHLRAILALSPAPQYRRFGSPGLAAVANYAAQQLTGSGYTVRHFDAAHMRYAPDYSSGHQPLLIRLKDGHRFKVDSAFGMQAVTGPAGVTCTIRQAADVRPGDCGLVPFAQSSPDFRNVTYGPGSLLAEIKARGGVAAVAEGDASRRLVLALRTTIALPTVVAVATDSELVGQKVRLRVMGGPQPAVLHDIIAVHRPRTGSHYVVLTAHMDGWFQAAADNGGGTAAVLRTAQLLSERQPDIGVAVALFDGEEVGLLGSQALAAQLARPTGLDLGDCGPPLHMADIVADVNLDAPSARANDVGGGRLPVFSWRAMVFSEEGVLASNFLSVFLDHGVAGLPLNGRSATLANGGLNRTDAHWFDAAGIPVVWPVAGYAEYHTDGDTLRIIDPADLEAVAAASADLGALLGSLPVGRVAGAPPAPPVAPFKPAPGCRR
ncbi:MAG TPA: M28 family peptidase [Acidimicrobiales bacterium]|nr:M28 family peptidase [Acidimicrobiales bacterium]